MRPYRNGSHHYLICPVGIFNGQPNPVLIIAGADRQWPLLCQAMGRPELAEDARFKGHMDRVTNAEEVKRIVQEWLDSQSSDKLNPGFKQGIRVGSAKDGKVTAFIEEKKDLGSLEGVGADDAGNVYAGYTGAMNLKRFVKDVPTR